MNVCTNCGANYEISTAGYPHACNTLPVEYRPKEERRCMMAGCQRCEGLADHIAQLAARIADLDAKLATAEEVVRAAEEVAFEWTPPLKIAIAKYREAGGGYEKGRPRDASP